MALPSIDLAAPRSLDEAVRLLAEAGAQARVLAGGTDLLVNMKHRLLAPRVLVSLAEVEGLRAIEPTEEGGLRIGAGASLAAVARSEIVRARAPMLAEACGAVAHPQVRTMGTLGGNVCLEVRCRFVNRTSEWRAALGGCLKSGGTVCHVVPGGRRCVATTCADSLPPLIALGAQAEIAGPKGTRTLPVEALRTKDGCAPLALSPGELVSALIVPPPAARRRAAYLKWAVRKAVDFPLVSVALVCDRDPAGRIESLHAVAGALGPRPRAVLGLSELAGERLTPQLAGAVAERVVRQCTPIPNVLYDPAYRRRLLGVLVRRRLESWALEERAAGSS